MTKNTLRRLEFFILLSILEEGYTVAHKEDMPTCGAYSVAVADYDENGEKDLVFSSQYDPEGKVLIE